MANASRLRHRKESAAKSGLYRIGMFSESFHPVQNGVTTSVRILIDCLRAKGHHVCMFAPAHERQPEQEAHVLRFPSFVSAFNKEYPLAYPFYPRLALETHFSRLRLDIVHTHTPFVMGLTGAKLALRRGVPLVSTFHTLYSQYTHYVPLLPDTVTQSLLEHYLPWYYNRCAEIICPSEVAARVLRERGIERPIQVIPTGIPLPPPDVLTQDSRCAARKRIGVQSDTPLMLFAGRLAREKNLEWLLNVFGRVRERVPSVRLAIAGGGPYTEELKTLAVPFDNGILFLGPLPRQELDTLFAACDVFVFPSPSETQGLVIGEARAAGAPCVVVDAGGAPETVTEGEDGFRVPAEDEEGFAARVVQILTNKSLADTLRAHALQNALVYTPERMVNSVLAVYAKAKAEAASLVPPSDVSLRDHATGVEVDWETLGQSVVEKFDETLNDEKGKIPRGINTGSTG